MFGDYTSRSLNAVVADARAVALEYRVAQVLVVFQLLSAPILCLIYMKTPPSPDQSQFDYMAWLSTQGHYYYAGSFDMNWPGAMMLHELGIRLFGVHAWTWRLTDFLLLQALGGMMAFYLWRSGFRLAPWIMVALYPVLYVSAGDWMKGQRDIIASGFILAACALAMPGGRREALNTLLAGALVGFAVLVRPTFLAFLFGMALLEALPLRLVTDRTLSRARRALFLLAGGGLPIIAVVAAGAWLGALDDWRDQSILFSLYVYSGAWPQDPWTTLTTLFVRSWHWMTLCGAIGLALWALRDGFSHALALALGAAATFALSFTVQAKGFGYHLGGFIPLLTILIAVGVDQLAVIGRSATAAPMRMVARGACLALAVLIVAGAAKKITTYQDHAMDALENGLALYGQTAGASNAERAALVEMIRKRAGDGDRMVQYGTMHDIPYRAMLLPSYRFINAAVDDMTPAFPLYRQWLDEVETDMRQSPPNFILFAHGSDSMETLMSTSEQRPILRMLVNLLDNEYEQLARGDNFLLFAHEDVVHPRMD